MTKVSEQMTSSADRAIDAALDQAKGRVVRAGDVDRDRVRRPTPTQRISAAARAELHIMTAVRRLIGL